MAIYPLLLGEQAGFFWVWFHLGGGQTKLHKIIVRYVKKSAATVLYEEEQEIPDAFPIDGQLRVDTIALQVDEDEIQAPNNGGKAPTPIVPNPDQIIQPPPPS